MTNKIFYRVTEVLKPFSGMSKIDPNILNAAAERGRFLHAVFDAKNDGVGHPDIPEAWNGYIDSTDIWASSKKFIKKPPRWFDEDHRITGECDGIYEDNGELVLFDLKFTAAEGKTWFLQGSAYANLARKAGFDIKRIEFVRLKKDGKKPCVYTYEEDFDMFLSCLKTYKKFFLNESNDTDLDYL